MYWEVKIQFREEQDSGKIKKTTELNLVEAETATHAEAIVVKDIGSTISDYNIVGVKTTKITKVLEYDESVETKSNG